MEGVFFHAFRSDDPGAGDPQNYASSGAGSDTVYSLDKR